MITAVMVGLGGMAGALLRFAIDSTFEALRLRRRIAVPPKPPFPAGTLLVNTLGSVIIGLAWGLLGDSALDTRWYGVWAAGLAGGLTTFSTFTVAAVSLWLGRRQAAAVVHVLANLACSLAAVWLGIIAAGAI